MTPRKIKRPHPRLMRPWLETLTDICYHKANKKATPNMEVACTDGAVPVANLNLNHYAPWR